MDFGQLAIGGAVEAVTLLVAAAGALWFERRARWRREVEEAALRLHMKWGEVNLALWRVPADREDGTSPHALVAGVLDEIQVKATGFMRPKRRRVRETAHQLRLGILACEAELVVASKPPMKDAVAKVNSIHRDLIHEVLRHRVEWRDEDLDSWIRLAGGRTPQDGT